MRKNIKTNIKKNLNIKPQKAFTLFEVVLALIIFSMLVGIIFTAYINIKKSEGEIGKQQIIVQESNDFLDRIHELSLDYTIDYEEYFNRTQSTCLSGSAAIRNTGGACDVFTEYGNTGSNGGMYYCNSNSDFDMSASGYDNYQFLYLGLNPIGCAQSGNQNFGQYNRQFRDTVDQYLNNGDDIFTGKGPIAISQNTGTQELYLINSDGDQRVLFRRKFITGTDLNGDGFLTGKNESLYTIQVLKLKGYDAGKNHDFDLLPANWGAYDGFIDTRACDFGKGFKCGGGAIPGYPNYDLPKNENDGREDITDSKITVSDWNFEIYPAKDPYLATEESAYLIDPFVQISMTVNLYGVLTDDEITLQTSLGFKNSYSNFDVLDLDEIEVGTGGGTTTGNVCGDGNLGGIEECDDGNIIPGDECNATCNRETRLSNCSMLTGHKEYNTASNINQDCNSRNSGGCLSWLPITGTTYDATGSATNCYFKCNIGYDYSGSINECIFHEDCGDGDLDGVEQCDDNNTTDGDSCDSNCEIENRTGACSSTGIHQTYNTVSSITQSCSTASGGACILREPSTLITYSVTGSEDDCFFTCDTGYVWNADDMECELYTYCGDGTTTSPNHDGIEEACDDGGWTGINDGCDSSCEKINTNNIKCDYGIPLASGFVRNTVAFISQTCEQIEPFSGCVSRLPSATSTYSITGSEDDCFFTCDTGYVWNISTLTCDLAPYCGDGNTDSGEECDDGNLINNDMCNNSCEKNQLFACADLNTSRSCVGSVGINPNGCNRGLAVTFSGLMLPTGLYYTQIKETLPQQLVRSSFLTQTMLESIVIPGTDQGGNYSFEIQISGQNLSGSPINCSLANIVMK